MGNKLRNHGGDTLVGMTQWIGRKIKFHDPLKETENFKETRAGGKLRIGVLADDPLKVQYLLADGRRYEISVREVSPEEPERKLVAVGH